jgi:hypothetical protein
MSIFPKRHLDPEKFNNLLNEADFILTVDLDFVNKSLNGFLIKKFKKLPKYKMDELVRKHGRFVFRGFVSNLDLKKRNPIFWAILFDKLTFPKNSSVFIEFIPDYDRDYYSINFPYTSNSVTTRDGVIFMFNKMEELNFYCFNNGTLDGFVDGVFDEPWYCCDFKHLKISLENNAYLVSNKSLLDFFVLFENTNNVFHPQGELEYTNDTKWIDFNLIDFSHQDLDNETIKNELKKLFDKKRISDLDDVFEEMLNRNVKDFYDDFDNDILNSNPTDI